MPMTLAMPRLGWLSRFLIDAAGSGSWPGGNGGRTACHRAQCPGYRELGYGQRRYGARHLRKEDSCPSLLHLVRIQVLPLRRAHPPTAPFRRCHTRPPTRTRTDPPRPADGTRRWHHCARCCAEPRQAPLNPKLRLIRQVIQGLTWDSVGLAGRCSGYFRVSGIGMPMRSKASRWALSAQTRGLLGARELALLPDGAVVVNVARGGILDENALAGELNSGRLGGAGLDVFAQEPLPGDSPLLSTPNTILSPHVAGYSERSSWRLASWTIEDVLGYLASSSIEHGKVIVAGTR